MIVEKYYRKVSMGGLIVTFWKGYYLFGFIPLLIKQINHSSYYENTDR